MPFPPGLPPPPRPPSSSKTRARIEELEAALALVRADRGRQVVAIEDEIRELHRIYERMSNDLRSLRAERDHAIEKAREERELREKETQELTDTIAVLLQTETAGGTETASAEAFVRARLRCAPTERRRLRAGEVPEIPGYRVTGVLGQGGMATVYEGASDPGGTPVAIKLLHEGPDASAGRVELFLREAAVMLRLDHPGLVRALDAGDSPHGRFLVLELVRGESLSESVRRRGPFSEREALRVALEVGRALAYCARVGLTHRDVKPSNLLRDAAGQVRICDFGLAALTSGLDPARPYGSPGYAAPEQIADPGSLDERVDVYSLGATLWHLVVGRRPFDGTPRQAFEMQRTEDLPDPRFEGADVSTRFAQVIRRMARADRDRRYRGWDECLLDLMLVENGNPPFSAHLAEALESATPGGTDTPTGPLPPAKPARTRSSDTPCRTPDIPVVTPLPARDGETHDDAPVFAAPGATEAPPAAEDPEAPPPAWSEPAILPDAAPPPSSRRAWRPAVAWALLAAAGVLGAGVGWGLARSAAPGATAAEEVETRALRLAERGDRPGAVAALRGAAAAFEGEDRARLLGVADRIEREGR